MYSFDNNKQALHDRLTALDASLWSAKALLIHLAVPYLVSCSQQHITGPHEGGELVSADRLQIVVVPEGILLQLGKLRKKACQYILAHLELRAGYFDFIF